MKRKEAGRAVAKTGCLNREKEGGRRGAGGGGCCRERCV